MAQRELTIEVFLMVAEMLFGHLRLKEADRWSEDVAFLKWTSFRAMYPEVSCQQLTYAAEMWIQSTAGTGFQSFPTWAELLAPIYRCDGRGLAVRAAGFKPDLPPSLQPTASQLALMQGAPDPRRALPPGADPAAYEVVSGSQPLIPEPPFREPCEGLTPEVWAAHLERCKEQQRRYMQGQR